MPQKIALITGCSSGIGLHCARELAKRSAWRVFAAARREEDASRLREEEGLEAVTLDLDASASIHAAMDEVLEKTGGRLDALFNNGAYGQPGATEDLSREALRAQFETNVFGTQELTNRAIAVMRSGGGGRIVQNSSVLGFVALVYRGAYVASKYALEGLTDTMRLELAGSGVRLILIEPGPITSDFRKNANAKFNQHFDADKIAASRHRRAYEERLLREGDCSPPPPFNLGPEAVYKALLHALEHPRPKTRYRVTTPTTLFWMLKRLLPTAALDAVLRKI